MVEPPAADALTTWASAVGVGLAVFIGTLFAFWRNSGGGKKVDSPVGDLRMWGAAFSDANGLMEIGKHLERLVDESRESTKALDRMADDIRAIRKTMSRQAEERDDQP